MTRIEPVYLESCPNCGGEISSDRLLKGIPCKQCIPNPPSSSEPILQETLALKIGEELKRRNKLKKYWEIYDLTLRLRDFSNFFSRATGGLKLWSAQRSWAKRLLVGESIAIVAP